jgi:hypothetical protein
MSSPLIGFVFKRARKEKRKEDGDRALKGVYIQIFVRLTFHFSFSQTFDAFFSAIYIFLSQNDNK